METVWRILEFVGVAIAGGWLYHILTLKSRVKQQDAETTKTEEEAKSSQIDNIKKIMDDLYQPMIDDLKVQVKELKGDVAEVKEENESLKKEVADLKDENARLKKENEELRDALREIRPDVVPSRRSINAQNQRRNPNGTFAKEGHIDEETEDPTDE